MCCEIMVHTLIIMEYMLLPPSPLAFRMPMTDDTFADTAKMCGTLVHSIGSVMSKPI